MTTFGNVPEQGQLVQIRSRQWVVNEVKPSSLPSVAMRPQLAGPQNLLTLSSVEDDGLGEELQVVWEIEPGARVIEKVALPEPTSFDAPDKLDAFLDAVRWGAASTADLKNIQAPFRSGIEIEDYQLDPVVRAIQMPRVNLLIADDVGLGKMLRFERDLHKQVQALMEQYGETRRELRLSPENITKVVTVALGLAGQPALISAKTEDGKPCFQLPLRGSWAACAEGLEHPHTKEIRPITFNESVSKGRDDVVPVHLNHRLPQMCLRLLRAEVWAEKGRSKLQRVTARVIPNDTIDMPAMVAHARLVVIGGDSHRLHEEIIAAGGLIMEGKWGSRRPGCFPWR